MLITHKIPEMRRIQAENRFRDKNVGFVPTMGFLHEGHLSLVRRARKDSDYVVLSIFVNPLQFGPHEDLEQYPRDLDKDIMKAREAGVDILFAPHVPEIYPQGFDTRVEVCKLTQNLCGSFRPGHFRGVTTVVAKLLNIVRPQCLYLGQKDAQQARVISRMITDLHMNVRVEICPVVRESDGLALSSRNQYLSAVERKAAGVLYRCLLEGEKLMKAGESSPAAIQKKMREIIATESLARLEYAACVDWETLQEPEQISAGPEYLLAIAVYIGQTRLIDNFIIEVGK